MKRMSALLCGVLLCAGAGNGQTAVAKATKVPTAAADVSGRWIGAFDIVHADGSVDEDKAIFLLKQEGSALTGTAGSSESRMSNITEGAVRDKDVRFAVIVHQDVKVNIALELEGGHLRGEATGLPIDAGSTVLINAARWPEGTDAPEIVHTKGGLTATVAALDTKLFNAYNTCDLKTMSEMVDDNLEFYHDKTGLTVGKQPFLEAIKNNICGKTQRTLVPGSLEVYPLKDYGAVEIGVHRFTHPGHPEEGMGEAKFVTLWENKDGTWKIARAISFDHENVNK